MSCFVQLGGAVTEKPLNLGILLRKRISIVPSTLRSRTLDYKQLLIREVTFEWVDLGGSMIFLRERDDCRFCKGAIIGKGPKAGCFISQKTIIIIIRVWWWFHYKSCFTLPHTSTVHREMPLLVHGWIAEGTSTPNLLSEEGQWGPPYHEGQ